MVTRTASARAPGSILSLDLFRQTRTITAATVHDGVSHRILVETSDFCPAKIRVRLILAKPPTLARMNTHGVRSHPGQCNMFNNYSYRQFSVSGGPTFFNFSPVSSTVQMQPAIQAWAATGATVNQLEPTRVTMGFGSWVTR